MGYLQRFAQYGARLVLHEQQRAVRFSFGYFLEEAQEVDVCEEEARCVVRQRRLRQGARGRVAKLVDFGPGGWWWWGWWWRSRCWAPAMLVDWWRGGFVVTGGRGRESGLRGRFRRVFRVEVAKVEEAEGWLANLGTVAIANVLEIFSVILLVDRSINVLMSKELEHEW